jgi:hypothetical protein
MKYLFLSFIYFISFSATAIELYQPPAIFTDSPDQTFNHQKSWFYFSKRQNSYVYQAYLPDFSKDDVKFSFKKRLVDGFQLDITVKKWITKHGKYLPTQELLNFSETVNIPDSDHNHATSGFFDNILTIKIPTY